MSRLKLTSALCLLCLALAGSAFAQQNAPPNSPNLAPSPEAQLLRALLDEVRQLRQTMQRATFNQYRTQTLTGQLARQQARVESLTEEVEQLKAAQQQSYDARRDQEELQELETAFQREPNSALREQLRQNYLSMQRALTRQQEDLHQDAERQRQRQSQLEINLRTEQARLAELQEQLDAVAREFDKPSTETNKAR